MPLYRLPPSDRLGVSRLCRLEARAIRTHRLGVDRGRSFCPACGSRLFSRNQHQIEIYLGTLDDVPNGIKPLDEGWIIRRDPWQHPIEGARQHEKDVAPM